ncbi:MAG: macrolide ABC transporter ATP-binding protein [Gammaproteobacteria bacterium 28-57-27]|nr:MAG: macrolide ABC transporter ATP-binding protein [Gammaproteobacteria bacterium 28-57-27]
MIELSQLCRSYTLGDSEVRALDDINLTIKAGEYISLMGPSGSGKSTLLNMLGLLDRPTQGVYRLEERDTQELDEQERARLRRERIGFVFQSFHLLPRLSAFDNVALPMLLAGMAPAERQVRVQAALDAVGLSERAHHRPNQLSGGQRQRVAIARATVMRPALLLADEPTGNLDSRSGAEVIELLESLNASGITLIVVTHDPGMGARARRGIVLRDGRVVQDSAQ